MKKLLAYLKAANNVGIMYHPLPKPPPTSRFFHTQTQTLLVQLATRNQLPITFTYSKNLLLLGYPSNHEFTLYLLLKQSILQPLLLCRQPRGSVAYSTFCSCSTPLHLYVSIIKQQSKLLQKQPTPKTASPSTYAAIFPANTCKKSINNRASLLKKHAVWLADKTAWEETISLSTSHGQHCLATPPPPTRYVTWRTWHAGASMLGNISRLFTLRVAHYSRNLCNAEI